MLNIFMVTYAASKFLSGRLYDKIGTRIGFIASIVVWSVAAAFHAVARGVISLSVVRGLLGLGEAGLWRSHPKMSDLSPCCTCSIEY